MSKLRRIDILHIGVLPLWSNQGDAIHSREMGRALMDQNIGVVHLNGVGPPAPSGSPMREIRVPMVERRFLRQLSWNLRASRAAIKAIREHDLDVVYSRLDPGMIVGLVAARATGRPLVVEVNGLPSDDIALYRPNNMPLRWLTRSWESLMYRASKRIVGAPGYLDYIQERFHLASDRFCRVPLGVNAGVFSPRDRRECLEANGMADAPVVVWSGQIQGWQGLHTLIDAAPLVKSRIPDVKIVIVGDGPLRSRIEERVRSAALQSTVLITGRVPYEDVGRFHGCASVCVATFPGERGRKGTISSLKIMTYLACGRPVITSDMDEMGPVIRRAGAGDYVPSDDPSALADALISLLSEPEARWGERCRRARLLAETRTWDSAASRVAVLLREVAE